MRFAYIDSQGKEVEIPSVDALRLRIELGAILDSTIFHDENTGKWAPAAEHEIYRTLQRELTELGAEGFTAPPPAPEVPARRPASSKGDQPVTGSGAPKPAAEGDDFLLGFEVELAPELSAEDEGPRKISQEVRPEAPTEEAPVAEAGFVGEEESGETAPDEEDEPRLSAEWGEEDAGPEGGDQDEPPPVAMEAGDELPDWAAPPSAREDLSGVEPDPGTAPVHEGPADPPPSTGGMSLEAPLSDYDADQPPEWMRKETPADWASATDEDPVPGDRGAEEFDPLAPRPEPRPRSAPPPRKLTRARTPGAGRVVVLLAVLGVSVVGVWYGSGYLAGLLGAGGPGDRGPSLPSLPAELQASMTGLTDSAVDSMAAGMARMPERAAVPPAPNTDWLAGVYLASPSRFPDVPEYWESVRTFVDAAEEAEDDLFRSAFDAALAASALSGEDAERVRERGLAGWQAAATDRSQVHSELRAVVDASLALHEFLLANEGQIRYEPAAGGVSRDPVLEAVPASESLGVAMWDRVGAITGALDTLGFLETMETEGLVDTYLGKLGRRAVR
ncbi:MAG TPA: hypothetical protein VLA43_05865, partial [Longimicrobiales bacterium]|nr:hypothetical protein [Longimicrobiales bacterium]